MKAALPSLLVSIALVTGGTGEDVHIPDPQLEQAVRSRAGLGNSAPITASDLRTLSKLDLEESKIADLTGIEQAVNLVDLDLSDNPVRRLDSLAALTHLETLDLTDCNSIEDLSPLAGLQNLRDLRLENRENHDLTVLPRSLKVLSLFGSEVRQNTDLPHLPLLQSLSFRGTPGVDVSDFSALTRLENLSASGITFSPTTALWNLPGLRHLSFNRHHGPWAERGGSIFSVIPDYVEELSLTENAIPDLENVGRLFPELRRLNLRRNAIADLSPLAGLNHLTYLALDGNRVTDLTPIASLPALEALYLGHNPVVDLEPLRGHPSLGSIRLWNSAVSSLEPLFGIATLRSVSTTGTFLDLTEGGSEMAVVDALRDRGVSVAIDNQRAIVDVPFVDPALNMAVREALDVGPTVIITSRDLATLSVLRVDGATSLEGLEHAINLHHLHIQTDGSIDTTPLTPLTNLTTIRIEHRGTIETDFARRMTFLRIAELGQVRNLSGLANKHRLERLAATGPEFTDLAPLQFTSRLQSLDIRGSRVSDLEALRGLTRLESLQADNTRIAFLNPLRTHRFLRDLTVRRCNLHSLGPLRAFETMSHLDVRDNVIADFTPIQKIRFTGEILLEGNFTNVAPGTPSGQAVQSLLDRTMDPARVRYLPQTETDHRPAPPRFTIQRANPGLQIKWPEEGEGPWDIFASDDLEAWRHLTRTPEGAFLTSDWVPDPVDPSHPRYFVILPVRAD
ncbi:MAG: leucine-rich repeat domain-containing protein [Verrucomicrobiota bacterium]